MKKILTSLLLAVLLFSSIPSKASALDITALQELIKSLQEQLAQMEERASACTFDSGLILVLKLGVNDADLTGAPVAKLQNFLISKGFLEEGEDDKGVYWTSTERALVQYQNSKGLFPRGFDEYTMRAINADCISSTLVSPTPSPAPIPQTTFYINFPTTGSKLTTSNSYTISWTGSDPKVSKYNVLLTGGKLSSEGIKIGTAYPRADGTVGTFSWTVPKDLAPASDYQIHLTGGTKGPAVSGKFNVISSNKKPTQSIKVLSPNGGESFQIGNSMTVKWDKGNCTAGEVSVVLRNESGFQGPIDSGDQAVSTSNDGSHTWTIGNIGDGGKYRVRVLCDNIGTTRYYDDSDGTFVITKVPQPVTTGITVYSPTASDVLTIGSKVKVEWTTKNIPTTETFLIRLRSVATGQEYNLVTGVLNDQSENVVIPPSLPEGYYTLEIKSSQSVIGKSGVFKVVPLTTTTQPTQQLPTVKVIAPNYAENIIEGSIYTIKWTATDATSVDLRLYHSETSTYDIVKGIPNTGSYNWKVSRMGTGQRGTYAIGVKAINGPVSAYDTSDQQFNIISSTTSSPVSSGDKANQLASIQATLNTLIEALKSLPN